jgi:nucleotide-binding universal stress UspA family protein
MPPSPLENEHDPYQLLRCRISRRVRRRKESSVFHRILWPVDPRKPAPPPIPLLRALNGTEDAVLHIVSVIEQADPDDAFAAWAEPPALEARQLFQSDVRRDLRTLARRAEAGGMAIETAVYEGSPLATVLRELGSRGCDLLAIRTRAIEENGGRIGGLTFDLLLHASTPVCCVRDIAPDFSIRRVLVATDLSARSLSALETALTIAARHGASVRLVHLLSGLQLAIDEQLKERLHDEAKAALKRWRASRPALTEEKVPVEEAVCEAAEAAQGIVGQARDWNADLIVISAQGWSGFSPLFFGSTARRVVRTSAVPVLVTRSAV